MRGEERGRSTGGRGRTLHLLVSSFLASKVAGFRSLRVQETHRSSHCPHIQ